MLDRIASDRNPPRPRPPPPPSAALLKLRGPVKDRQALQGEKKTIDKSQQPPPRPYRLRVWRWFQLAPAARGSRAHTTDPFQASTRPVPEAADLSPPPPADLRPPPFYSPSISPSSWHRSGVWERLSRPRRRVIFFFFTIQSEKVAFGADNSPL